MSLADVGRDLAELVAAEAPAADVPGMAIGIAHGDERDVVTFGVTNVEHPLAVDARTLFQIGSTTKTFTATAVMRLCDEGRLDVDAPVTAYLPTFRLADDGDGEAVTIRHLLTHTGGWAGDWFLLHDPDYGRDGALARVVDDMAQAPRIVSPGTAFSYNNAGFYVLGRLLEALTDQSYPDAVRRLVLDPVGLGHSFFFADEMLTHRVAAGHVAAADGGVEVHRPWPRPFFAWPAGALNSCVDDLLAWARFWGGDGRGEGGGERILDEKTMAAMTTPVVAIDRRTAIGLAWMVEDVGGVRVVGHGGATNGYLTEFAMVPEQRVAVAVLSNSTTAAALNRRIRRWLLERVAGAVTSDPAPLPMPAVALREFAGRYGLGPSTEWAHAVEVDATGEEPALLFVPGTPSPTPTPTYRLVPVGDDEVLCVDPPAGHGLIGTFGRDTTGAISWFRFGLRVYNRLN